PTASRNRRGGRTRADAARRKSDFRARYVPPYADADADALLRVGWDAAAKRRVPPPRGIAEVVGLARMQREEIGFPGALRPTLRRRRRLAPRRVGRSRAAASPAASRNRRGGGTRADAARRNRIPGRAMSHPTPTPTRSSA